MEYRQHRHDGVLKPGEDFDPRGQAGPRLHELLERKGFKFQPGSDYYCLGEDIDWYGKDLSQRPLICVYRSGTWDGRPVLGYPMKVDAELSDYLDSLPDVSSGSC